MTDYKARIRKLTPELAALFRDDDHETDDEPRDAGRPTPERLGQTTDPGEENTLQGDE
jgi:hypothetical protein